jgi:hypothetical protein
MTRFVAVCALAAMLSACGDEPARCGAAPNWPPLVLAHRERYPLMQPEDAYKLLHHATMGSEHAAPDRAGPAAWMDREWAEMGEGPAESLIDTLGAGGRFVRVQLRSWRAAGGSPDALVDAFVLTASTAEPDTSAMRCALDALLDLARKAQVPWDTLAMHALIDARRAEGYPAVHHSDAFEAAYQPAYRVVAVGLVPELLASLPRPAS